MEQTFLALDQGFIENKKDRNFWSFLQNKYKEITISFPKIAFYFYLLNIQNILFFEISAIIHC
jgi:hypothetical protein